MAKIIGFSAAGGLLLAGCASTPPVTVNYFHPRADMEVSVVQSVACDDQQTVHYAHAVLPKLAYSADLSAPQEFRFASLSSGGGSADTGITLREDGRLQGINSTQTGAGAEIVDAMIGLAGAAGGLAATGATGQTLTDACQYIEDYGDKGVITFTYHAIVDFNSATPARIVPVRGQESRYGSDVRPILGSYCLLAQRTPVAGPVSRISLDEGADSSRYVNIELREAVPMSIAIAHVTEGSCPASIVDNTRIWAGTALVPQMGGTYNFPIPRAAFFGSQTAKLGLSEAGVPLTVQYASTSGATSLVGAATSVIEFASGDTVAQQAAEVDAQADLIYQQQRLLRCQVDPSTCPS